MSMPPNMIQQMLMQKLQQGAPQGSIGSGATQGNSQISPLNAGSTLMQKVMLMKALQNPPPSMAQRQSNAMMPQSNAMASGAQIPQAPPMQMPQSLTDQQIQAVNPALQPQPGIS